jgi:hypothetical protein
MYARSLCVAFALTTLAWIAPCQEISATQPAQPSPNADTKRSETSEPPSRHILDPSSLIIYTIIISSILYFQRNTTGASLISSKY